MITDAKELIDHLTYANYSHNRRISPNISPARWAKIYGSDAIAMEARYASGRTLVDRACEIADRALISTDSH